MPKKKRKPSLYTQARLKVFRTVAFAYPWNLRTGDFGAAGGPRLFSVKLYVAPIEEMYTVPECHSDITMKSLKSRLEIMVGIPVNFQRLQYLDEMDLDDNSTFKDNDIIPGGTMTMQIWHEDGWTRLVQVAAKGNVKKFRSVGATKASLFRTEHASRLKKEELNKWLAHRIFVALFVTVCRNSLNAVKFLLDNGADVKYKSPLGRTVLHVAAATGRLECIDILLKYGAKASEEDYEGYNPATIARAWGQKESERRLFRFQWVLRTTRSPRPSSQKIQS